MKVFLEAPRGITEPVTVTAGGIKSSAVTVGTESFLLVQIWANGKVLGTADMLRAAMTVLCGEQSVTVVRTNSLFRSISCPRVCDCSFAGTWRHSDAFRDKHLSNRLRLQCRTFRF